MSSMLIINRLVPKSQLRLLTRSLRTMATPPSEEYNGIADKPLTSSIPRIPSRTIAPHSKDRSKAIASFFTPRTSTPAFNDLTTTQAVEDTRLHAYSAVYHPVYTAEETAAVKVIRRERKTKVDKVAGALVYLARWGFDTVTRYKHDSPEAAAAQLKKEGKENLSLEEKRKLGFVMTVDQWMMRILFLESIAGVPGFSAAIVRHLRSLRLMKRDNGWIHTLLQEAENERMHLLSFLAIKGPSPFFRVMVLVAQGVFFNVFFAAYLISPKAAHRFVATLEEEACLTYTQILHEMEIGNIPEWTTKGGQAVPQIAVDYWRLKPNATMTDMILAVRADEAGHRFTNHTLANLDQDSDFNPFGLKHPTPVMQGTLAGLEREESLAWSQNVREEEEAKLIQAMMEEDAKRQLK